MRLLLVLNKYKEARFFHFFHSIYLFINNFSVIVWDCLTRWWYLGMEWRRFCQEHVRSVYKRGNRNFLFNNLKLFKEGNTHITEYQQPHSATLLHFHVEVYIIHSKQISNYIHSICAERTRSSWSKTGNIWWDDVFLYVVQCISPPYLDYTSFQCTAYSIIRACK